MSAEADDRGAAVDALVATFLAAWPREVGQWSDLTLALWHAELDYVPDGTLTAAVLVAVRTLDRPPTIRQFRELVGIEVRRGQVTPALPPAPSDPAERERVRAKIAEIRANLAGPARSKR